MTEFLREIPCGGATPSALGSTRRPGRVRRKSTTLLSPERLKIHSVVRIAAEGKDLSVFPKPLIQRTMLVGKTSMAYVTG